VSGEAILSAENSGKSSGGQGSAPNPAGGAHSTPPAGGEMGCCPFPRIPSPLSAFGPSSSTQRATKVQSWPKMKSPGHTFAGRPG